MRTIEKTTPNLVTSASYRPLPSGCRYGSGAAAFAGEGRSFDPPADDPLRVNPDPCGVPTGTEFFAASGMQLGSPPDLDPAWRPGIHAFEIVDHKRNALVCLQVAPFLGGAQSMTTNVDGLRLGIQAKADGDDMRTPVPADGCQPAQALPTQIVNFLFGEMAHS